jgi:hypothetical protein
MSNTERSNDELEVLYVILQVKYKLRRVASIDMGKYIILQAVVDDLGAAESLLRRAQEEASHVDELHRPRYVRKGRRPSSRTH